MTHYTHFGGVFLRVQDEPCINDFPRQRKHIQWPVDEVIPAPGYVQAAQLVVATCLVLD